MARAIAHPSQPRKGLNIVQMAAVATVLCYPAGAVDLKQNLLNRNNNIASFDTDSKCSPIGVDNRCSACISDDRDDFEGPLMTSKRVIKGFGGVTTKGVQTGTLLWRWADDTGKTHSFRIPNSYYVPQGGVKLLSPQHLAQLLKDVRGTGEETNSKECVLYWNNHQHRLTIPLGRINNVATLMQAPNVQGYSKFHSFCHQEKNRPRKGGQFPPNMPRSSLHHR